MNPFFEYLIKSSLSLALFYIVFKLSVSRDKMHSVNRFVLLGILVGSAILPFINITIVQETEVMPTVEVFRDFVAQPVFYTSTVSDNIEPIQQTKSIHINWSLIFYLSIITALFIRLLISVMRVFQIINRAEKQLFQKIVIAVVKDFIQPFSFLKNIIISKKDYTENREIIVAHEYAHITHFHAIDLLICELFTALHWFNPFIWFLRYDLKLIHEFQADQAVLNKGIDAKKYQLLVLQKSVGERRFALANYFTQKPILKRLKMMQQKNKKQWNGVKLILFIPIVLLLLQAFAKPELLVEKASDFVPAFQQNETKKWLERWTVENINNGVFQPNGLKSNEYPMEQRNTLRIILNCNNDYLIENESVITRGIKIVVGEYLNGKHPLRELEPDIKEKELPFIGKVKISKSIIFFNYDTASSVKAREYSLKLIGEAYLEARQKKATKYFNQDYFSLNEEKRDDIDEVIPILFSYSTIIISKPPPVDIILAKDGKVKIGDKKFFIDEFEDHIIKVNTSIKESYKKRGSEFSLIVNLIVEVGVTDNQIKQLKEALRKAGIFYINYSSKKERKTSWRNEYDQIEFDGRFGLTLKNGKMGLVDINGKVIIPNEYDQIEFDGRLGLTLKNGKMGLVDINGKVIIPNEYDQIEFDGRLGLTLKNGKMGLIDITGKVIIPNEYDALEIEGNKVHVLKNGKQKIITI